MFGHHKAKREKRRLKEKTSQFEREKSEFDAGAMQREKDAAQLQNQQVAEKSQQSKMERQNARKEGADYAQEVLNRDVQGLDPEKRKAMQYEANKGIQRSMQSTNRKLLGDQASRGIVGKGGVGYAQQRDLQRMGTEAQAGVTRDLDKLNSDLALKKIAAMFNIEQGEAAQSQLDKQMAIDELQLGEEKKRQRMYEDQAHKLFSRI